VSLVLNSQTFNELVRYNDHSYTGVTGVGVFRDKGGETVRDKERNSLRWCIQFYPEKRLVVFYLDQELVIDTEIG